MPTFTVVCDGSATKEYIVVAETWERAKELVDIDLYQGSLEVEMEDTESCHEDDMYAGEWEVASVTSSEDSVLIVHYGDI